MKKLSILVCSLIEKRRYYRERLSSILKFQLNKDVADKVEILFEVDNGEQSIGDKRNTLLSRATGEYLCFIDDDDRPSWDYIQKVLDGLKTNPDCLSLNGVITYDGLNPELFIHSILYDAYESKRNEQGAMIHYRYPNHLNVIRSSIAKQFKFPNINHGEDTDFATQIHKSKIIKVEQKIDGIIYHYDYRPNKTIKI